MVVSHILRLKTNIAACTAHHKHKSVQRETMKPEREDKELGKGLDKHVRAQLMSPRPEDAVETTAPPEDKAWTWAQVSADSKAS
eukprot:4535237-Pyramimonas_sp.AAC.1